MPEPKRVWNPPNPYLTEHRDLLGEPPVAELEVYEDQSQSILSHNDSPDLGFRWSINPYRGCFHACAYCLLGDTPIAMADGRTKPLADVQVGDEIYGVIFRGKYHRLVRTPVLAHWRTVKPAYRVTLEDGTQVVSSADHRFLTNRGWKCVTASEQERHRRPHLTTNNELLGTGGFVAPPDEDIDYRQGYLCGMVRGDGLLASDSYHGRRRANETAYQFRLALIDFEAQQRAGQYLAGFDVPTHSFLLQRAAVGYKAVHAIRTSAQVHVKRVASIIRWPVTSSQSWSKGFLAGIFDAGGCYSRGILRISNTDKIIIDRISECLRRLNFDVVIETRPRERPVYDVRIRGGLREHLRFFHTVNPAITRKMDIAGQAIKNGACLRVQSIEPVGLSLPLYDITTGAGNFIANGIVSHNCYARPTHEYFGFGAGTDFERKIFVKRHAPALLERAFRRPSWQGERVVFSGVTDCYQPLEAAWRLTRGCLSVCLAFRNPAAVITKSLLIRRDVDVLAALAREADVTVSLSIPFLDEAVARLIEPGAPTIRRRFETMEILARAGVPVGIGVAPIIPGLNDADIPGLLKEARRCGASFAFRTLLRLPGSVTDVFFHRLKEAMPMRAAKIERRIREVRDGRLYDSRFGRRHSGAGMYWEAVDRLWDVWTHRLGFDQGEDSEERPSTFRRPPARGPQLEFAFPDAA
jgi:DNA repair photolyase